MDNTYSQKQEDYCTVNSSGIPKYLLALERETNIKTINPRMLSGQLQGRVLSMISKLVKPKRILEIGTFTGYSALCLAEGLDENGSLESIEVNAELEPIINKYISMSPFKEKIRIHFGNAKEVCKKLDGPYDIVFLDARKEDYIQFYDLILPLMLEGGLILADNVLWSGKVFLEPEDPTARAIHRFNRYVLSDDRVESIILPIRDGLSMIRKKRI